MGASAVIIAVLFKARGGKGSLGAVPGLWAESRGLDDTALRSSFATRADPAVLQNLPRAFRLDKQGLSCDTNFRLAFLQFTKAEGRGDRSSHGPRKVAALSPRPRGHTRAQLFSVRILPSQEAGLWLEKGLSSYSSLRN